ncbi:MAG: hypothetical protein ACI9AD_000208 [Nitriliruptoraceae bacterium]
MRPRRPTELVGWREWVRIPSLTPHAVKAKVDTGARTSSLHAFDLRVTDGIARFAVHPHQRDDSDASWVELPVLENRTVRPSTGEEEERPVVVVEIVLGPDRFEVELTLTDRDQMGFRMLLGRTALRARYVVDPGRSYQRGERPR